MAPGVSWATRSLLTGLYIIGGLASGASLATNLMQWFQDMKCLPPITSSFGDPIHVTNALGRMCDVITYGSGVVSGLCLVMAVSINLCWGFWGWSMVHQSLTLLMSTMSVTCGTALTVDFVIWCHTLRSTLGHSSCKEAASHYDFIHNTSNMTAYFKKMEVQQVCQWAVVPILMCAIVLFSGVMRHSAAHECRQRTARYETLNESNESNPLLRRETSLVRIHSNPRQQGHRPRRSGRITE